MIEIKNVSKSYDGNKKAIDNISFKKILENIFKLDVYRIME